MFKIWLLAIRPKTLIASIAPVVMATAMAFSDGVSHLPMACVCLLTALCLQIGTNLTNDYCDFIKGADTVDRLGPTRVTQAGLVKPKIMKNAIILTFGLAILGSVFLINRGGWPIAVLGILALLSGIFYTAGPRPLGYLGFGDILVLIFFGPVAVAGTYYVQSYELNMAVVMAGLAVGLISVAILSVNNLRDICEDRKADKKTLAVRFGRSFVETEYIGCILIASLIPVFIYAVIEDHRPILFASVISLLAIPNFKRVCTSLDGPALNQVLASTGQLLFIFSLLFSLGWIY